MICLLTKGSMPLSCELRFQERFWLSWVARTAEVEVCSDIDQLKANHGPPVQCVAGREGNLEHTGSTRKKKR